ncbi:MAG TPA: hypothetical protein VNC50_00020, partial [Planctomycetia bacterium]|nr:hypothetical protein [Planctomycetia bacterium]
TRDRRTVLQSEFPVRFAQMARIELPWIGGTLCAGVVAALLARRRPRLAATFAAASLAIDLGHHARGWYPRIEPDFHAERGLARHIKRHGDPPRVFSNVIANNIRGFGISEIGYRYGLDRFRRLTEYLYYERGLLFDVSSIDEIGHLPLETRRMHDFRRRLVEPSKLLRIGGFAFELAPEPPSRPADYVGAHAFLTTVPDSIPFAAVIPSAISVEPDAALDELTRPEYDPAKSVVIENPSVTDPKPGRFAPAKTEWLGPNAFRVTLPEDSQGWLNVTELWYPGWTAHSAGRELPIERANHLFQAVRVAPGTKVVEFRFTSDRFRLGLFIAGPTLLAAFALLGFAPRGGPPAGNQGPGVSSLWTIVLLGAFVGSFALSALVRRNEWAKAFPTVLIAARTAQPGGGSPR